MPTENPKIWNTDFIEFPSNSITIDFHMEGEPMDYVTPMRKRVAVSGSEVPKYLHFGYPKYSKLKKDQLPDIFKGIGSVLILSKRFGDLLQDFELGPTQLFPMDMYEHNQTDLRPEKYYLLHMVNRAEGFFVPEASENIREVANSGIWRPNLSDSVLTLRSGADEGMDLL